MLLSEWYNCYAKNIKTTEQLVEFIQKELDGKIADIDIVKSISLDDVLKLGHSGFGLTSEDEVFSVRLCTVAHLFCVLSKATEHGCFKNIYGLNWKLYTWSKSLVIQEYLQKLCTEKPLVSNKTQYWGMSYTFMTAKPPAGDPDADNKKQGKIC